jgi:dTDP-4-amino-4,6-dideoxygalactose transaminase
MYPKSTYYVPYKTLYFEDDTKQAALKYMDKGVCVLDDEPSYLLEKAWAQYFGVKHSVAVMNGSWAGMLSLFGLGIGQGDEVIVQANTDYPISNQIVHLGAKPVFVDCEHDTQNIDPTKIEKKITSKTKVITVVHMMGHPTDMDPIMEMARKHGLFVVEDSCHSTGAKYKGKLLPMGDVSYNSFHGKQLWTAGGGALVYTDNEEVAEKIRLERYHGTHVRGYPSYKDPYVRPDGIWEHKNDTFSMNYRMAEIDAVVALSQLPKLQKYIDMQRQTAKMYTELLRGTPVIPPVEKDYAYHTFCRYVVKVPGGKRDELENFLEQEGVECSRHYPAPIPLLRVYAERYGFKKGDFPVTERFKDEQLALPEPRFRTHTEIEYVAAKIKEFYKVK